LLDYENSVLEKKYPEFNYLMNEFHDGMLLFEISGRRVWNRVSGDSLGLKDYYQQHKSEWLSQKGINAKIYTLRSQTGGKDLQTAYNKYFRKSDADKLLLQKFNTPKDTVLVIRSGNWYKGEDKDLDGLDWSVGSHSFTNKGYPALAIISNILEPAAKSLTEVKGEVMSGYQDFLEKEWIGQLNKKYDVRIEKPVLEDVLQILKNE